MEITMLRLTLGTLALTLFVVLAPACGEVSDGGIIDTCRAPVIEPGQSCTAFCAQVTATCTVYTSTEECCGRGCQSNLDDEYAHADACGEAVEAVFSCVSELENCQEVRDWQSQTPSDDFPCREEVRVVDGLIADGTCLP